MDIPLFKICSGYFKKVMLCYTVLKLPGKLFNKQPVNGIKLENKVIGV